MTALSPDVRSGPKGLSGEISAIDTTKRTLALRSIDEKGYEITTGFFWRESKDLDTTMQKQKQGWYVALTYEVQGERNMLSDCKYAERPANMKRQGKPGWQGGKPRNEKIIVLQSTLKVCGDVFCHCANSQELSFDQAMHEIKEKAIEIAKDLMKEGGA